MPSSRIFRQARGVPQERRRAAPAALLGVLALGAATLLTSQPAQAAQAPVGLGTATGFAVLAGAGITNTGATTVNGDIGTFPTPSETGFGSITQSGVDHAGDAVTQQAKNDLVSAYGVAAGAGPAATVATELGGTTLTPGVYQSPTLGITGALTLDAQGDPAAVFIFQASSTLITASASTVVGINGLDPCNVFWEVGSSATLGTNSTMVGTILASASITATTGAVIQGRLLASDGAVTLDHNTIARPLCTTPTPVTTAPTTPTTSAPIAPIVLTTPPVSIDVPTTTPITVAPTSPGTATAAGSQGNLSSQPVASSSDVPPSSATAASGTPALPSPLVTPGTVEATTVPIPPIGTAAALPPAPAMPPSGSAPGIPPSLAFTGSNPLLALVALTAIAGGALLLGLGRRHRSRENE